MNHLPKLVAHKVVAMTYTLIVLGDRFEEISEVIFYGCVIIVYSYVIYMRDLRPSFWESLYLAKWLH